jgi:hypothetical protein
VQLLLGLLEQEQVLQVQALQLRPVQLHRFERLDRLRGGGEEQQQRQQGRQVAAAAAGRTGKLAGKLAARVPAADHSVVARTWPTIYLVHVSQDLPLRVRLHHQRQLQHELALVLV